jgi:large subunit ribosomal protein L25
VDVSALNIGDSIHVRDIRLPEGVKAKVQPDLTVFSVLEPAVEEEPAVAATEAAAAGPEVITEKKPGEGEAAPAAAAAAPAKEKEPKK